LLSFHILSLRRCLPPDVSFLILMPFTDFIALFFRHYFAVLFRGFAILTITDAIIPFHADII